VREHHPLGIGGGAGGVEQGSDNVRGDGGWCEAARARGKDAVKIGHRRGLRRTGVIVFVLSRIYKRSPNRQSTNRFPRRGEMLDIAE